MQLARPMFATHPKQFGRGRMYEVAAAPTAAPTAIADEVKLFAKTFLVGFVFVSILIS